ATLSADCSGTIAAAETKTCTITNDDQHAHLTVIKTLINDHAGTKKAADFSITVTSNGVGLPSFPGSASGTDVTVSAGTYSVDERSEERRVGNEGGCRWGTWEVAQNKTCSICNDDNAATLHAMISKHV